MTIRFQADANFNQDIVTSIQRLQPDIDFQTAFAAGLQRLPDAEVLALAASQARILVTHDRKTMPGHFADFIATNTSPGVLIVSRKLAVKTAIETLILIWAASTPEEWANQIAGIPL